MNAKLLANYLWLKGILQSPTPAIQIILRIFAAFLGGYILTYSGLAALALLLPWPRVDVVFFSAIFPSLFWLGAILWAFAAPTALRAWRNILWVIGFCGSLDLIAAWVHKGA